MSRFSRMIMVSAFALSLAVGTAAAAGTATHAKPSSSAKRMQGHYAGQNRADRSISFDVVRSKGKLAVENFAVDVDTECWNDFDGDGNSDRLLVHIGGFSSRLSKDGSFDIYYAPDDDTEFEFTGALGKRRPKVDVIVGGTFTSLGIPDFAGAYQCDSWGDTYKVTSSR